MVCGKEVWRKRGVDDDVDDVEELLSSEWNGMGAQEYFLFIGVIYFW